MELPDRPGPAESLASICARGGWTPDFTTRPSAPPVYMTTAFDLVSLEQLDGVAARTERGYIYTRDGNPNHEAFAADVARLERAAAGCASASGMGALAATLLSCLRPGDHVAAARVLYGKSYQLLKWLEAHFQVRTTFFDARRPETLRDTLVPQTKLCLVESLSNPLIEVCDVAAVVEAASRGAAPVPVLVDSTFATPCLYRPIEHGASLVYHSASKYLNGHGDVMLGVVAGEETSIGRIRQTTSLFGTNANPFECWLASRGLRTLPLRMARVSATASELAEYLETHPRVKAVHYPGLKGHPDHALAARLLPAGCGGMLSFEIEGGRAAVDALIRRLAEAIPFSPTLADCRTTVSYPAGTSHKFLPAEERRALGIGEGLVRLSVGLEEPADVRRELDIALRT